MLKNLLAPKKEDICPNCGTACFATDVLCPNCKKNLDILFEQLPDVEESHSIFKLVIKQLTFLNWLVPLLINLSPMLVALITALLFGVKAARTSTRALLQLIWYVVSSSALIPSALILASSIPLFLITIPIVRAKLNRRVRASLSLLISIAEIITLWLGLTSTSVMSVENSFGFFGGLVQVLGPADWVYYIIACGIVLIGLNLMVIIGLERTA